MPDRLRTSLVAAVLMLLPLAGCSDSSDPTGPGGGGASDFSISVSAGVNPTYSWTTGAASSLSVVRTASPADVVWGIVDPTAQIGTTNLDSPVTHGSVKSGTIASFNTEPTLTAGVQYRVIVTRLNGQTGWTEFTP